MNYRAQRKNLELFKQLKSKGYTTSLIFKDGEIVFVTLNINGRQILLSYQSFGNYEIICSVGEVYKNDTICCTYGFKDLPNNIIDEYINSLSIDIDDNYIKDINEYQKAFDKYISDNKYVIKVPVI